MKKTIKLMAEYIASPLWRHAGWPDNIGYIPLDQFLLSKKLSFDLDEWLNTYSSWLNWDDPGNSPPQTQEEIDAFETEGLRLWKQLIYEIGHEYEIVFFSHKHHRVFDSIDKYNTFVEGSLDD